MHDLALPPLMTGADRRRAAASARSTEGRLSPSNPSPPSCIHSRRVTPSQRTLGLVLSRWSMGLSREAIGDSRQVRSQKRAYLRLTGWSSFALHAATCRLWRSLPQSAARDSVASRYAPGSLSHNLAAMTAEEALQEA